MTKALLIIVVLLLSFVIYFIVLGKISRSSEPPLSTGEKLPPCPDKPNCVCSEFNKDSKHYINPIPLEHISGSDAIQIFEIIILEMDGQVISTNNTNLSATFSSSFFGFVDDMQVRIDTEQKLVHFRSASRVGHSDLGVNRKRIELIKQHFAKMNRASIE